MKKVNMNNQKLINPENEHSKIEQSKMKIQKLNYPGSKQLRIEQSNKKSNRKSDQSRNRANQKLSNRHVRWLLWWNFQNSLPRLCLFIQYTSRRITVKFCMREANKHRHFLLVVLEMAFILLSSSLKIAKVFRHHANLQLPFKKPC